MKRVENPPRLLEHPEFGRDWSAAAQEAIEPERLRQLGDGMAQAVRGLGAGAATSGAGLTAATTAKVLVPVFVVGAATAGYFLRGRGDPLREPPRAAVVKEPIRPEVSEPQDAKEPEPVKQPARTPRVSLARRQPAPTERVKQQASELPVQLREFQTAQQEAAAGDYGAALGRISRLEERFPKSPLSTDMELARADWLVRAGKYAEATVQIQKLLLNRDVAGKKGTLFQLLGDAWMKRGRCDRAVRAYENALSHGVDDEQAAMVRTAIENCR